MLIVTILSISIVERVFRRMDDDGSKSLAFNEFANGISESGLKLNTDMVRALFDQFDSDDSGCVSINEFLLAVRVTISFSSLILLYSTGIVQ